MKKGFNNWYVILTLILTISYIFKDKFIYLAPNSSVSVAIIGYSLTFIIPIIIYNKYKSLATKKMILLSALWLLLFYFIVTILSTIAGNMDSSTVESALRTIFTPNKLAIFNTIIYYPDYYLIAFLIIYIFSHLILISVYDALTSYANKYISFPISLFIAFIIDTIFMVLMYNIDGIYQANIEIIYLVKQLTASFMIVIVTSLIMSAVYPFITKTKSKK